ncbi:fibronectin type iii [Lucifera butyrica]|uniref:Fibronectin type iii n=1 Tax=Lucifera butyrica TaxID=1351585 RepID=A0A498R5T1_9FIRM|nr:LamG domain-containing protein [Lucifera butyrica]VBB05553.1 fibronectin type iii [Lucifera butyrica]
MYQMDQYTVSLLHFDGGITDESGKVWTAQNGAATSTAQSKFGGASLFLNGTNQYLTTSNSTDFDFGNGDFTVDWWEYRETGDGNNRSVFVRDGADTTAYTSFLIGNVDVHGTGISCVFSGDNTSWDVGTLLLGTAILNSWTHYAVVRKGSTFYGFQNGTLKGTLTSSASLAPSNGNPAIGKYFDKNQNTFQGYIDEFRVSNVARWTSNFAATAPTNLTAIAGDAQVTLSWDAVDGATSYNVKRAATSGGPYTTVASNVTTTSYVDNTVTNGTTYYYVVTVVDSNGNESANSNEASATPIAPSGHGLLRITMLDSSEREYELSDNEINKFIEWCNRTVGTGNAYYSFDKTYNVGEFKNRKEYLMFEKIISFEVMELTK